jgi:hypothetical protein
VITFSGCKINTAGNGYKLHATDGALTAADSNAFTVAAGAASKFLVTPSSSTPNAGSAFTVTLTAQDAAGNTDTNYNGNHAVTWSGAATSPSGQAPSYPSPNPTTVNFTNGVSTTTLSATLYAAGANTLTGTAAAVSGTANLTVAAGAASKLAWVPVSNTHGTLGGLCFFTCSYTSVGGSGTTFKARIRLTDNFGNPVNAGSAFNVTVTKSAGTFTGSSTVTIPAGGSQSTSGGDATASGEITFNSESGGSWGPDTLGMTNTGGIGGNATASFSK